MWSKPNNTKSLEIFYTTGFCVFKGMFTDVQCVLRPYKHLLVIRKLTDWGLNSKLQFQCVILVWQILAKLLGWTESIRHAISTSTVSISPIVSVVYGDVHAPHLCLQFFKLGLLLVIDKTHRICVLQSMGDLSKGFGIHEWLDIALLVAVGMVYLVMISNYKLVICTSVYTLFIILFSLSIESISSDLLSKFHELSIIWLLMESRNY